MKTSFRKSFARDLKKLKDQALHDRIQQAIEDVEADDELQDIVGLKKLAGTDDCYRLRIGTYRIGVVVAGSEVIFVHCLHRRELYRFFP